MNNCANSFVASLLAVAKLAEAHKIVFRRLGWAWLINSSLMVYCARSDSATLPLAILAIILIGAFGFYWLEDQWLRLKEGCLDNLKLWMIVSDEGDFCFLQEGNQLHRLSRRELENLRNYPVIEVEKIDFCPRQVTQKYDSLFQVWLISCQIKPDDQRLKRTNWSVDLLAVVRNIDSQVRLALSKAACSALRDGRSANDEDLLSGINCSDQLLDFPTLCDRLFVICDLTVTSKPRTDSLPPVILK